MTNDIENTMNATWQLLKRLIWVLVLAVVGVYAAFRYGPQILSGLRAVTLSVLAAVLLTYCLLPSVDNLCRRRSRRMQPRTQRLLATILVMFVFIALVALGITLFMRPVTHETKQFSSSVKHFFVQMRREDLFNMIYNRLTEAVPADMKTALAKLDYSKLTSLLSDSMQGIVLFATRSIAFAFEVLLIPVLTFYFLLDHKTVTRELYGFVPRNKRRDAVRIGRQIGQVLQSYIFGQLILCVIAGVLTGIFLGFMHVPYVVVLALFAGLTRAIPVIGPVASGIPIVLVGMLNAPGKLTVPVTLLIFIIVMHFVESKFIMPQLIGERLHLHPAVVIIVLLIGAQFFGLVGMFLAAPAAAIVREAFRLYYIHPAERAEKRELENAKSVSEVEPLP